MLIGIYFCKLGKDGKVVIPQRIRKRIKKRIFIIETKDCLYLYLSEESLKKIFEKIKDNDQKRVFLASIVERKIDKQGKLKISDFKNFYLELGENKKIVISERNEYFEIWSEEKWIKHTLKTEKNRKNYSFP